MTRDEERVARKRRLERQTEAFLGRIPKQRARQGRNNGPLRPPLAQDVSKATEGLRDSVDGAQASRSAKLPSTRSLAYAKAKARDSGMETTAEACKRLDAKYPDLRGTFREHSRRVGGD